jgi:hypothetical protein
MKADHVESWRIYSWGVNIEFIDTQPFGYPDEWNEEEMGIGKGRLYVVHTCGATYYVVLGMGSLGSSPVAV